MSEIIFNNYPQFFTSTILEWKHLIAKDTIKDIIINSLQFLVEDNRVKVYTNTLLQSFMRRELMSLPS